MTLWTFERHCGFGDTTFGILWGGDPYAMPAWQQATYAVDQHVPGGNVTITQLIGFGTLTQTYRLFFEDATEFAAFLALRHTSDALTVFATMCELPQTPPDEDTGIRAVAEVVIFGNVYKRIQDVLLRDVTEQTISVTGNVECTAVFQLSERPS